MKPETFTFVTDVNNGLYDGDLNFILEATVAVRLAVTVNQLISRLVPGTVSPKYMEGATVEIIGPKEKRVSARLISTKRYIPSNGRFRVGGVVNFLPKQLEPA